MAVSVEEGKERKKERKKKKEKGRGERREVHLRKVVPTSNTSKQKRAKCPNRGCLIENLSPSQLGFAMAQLVCSSCKRT